MHAANHREIFSLYAAILILARRGRKVRLIRTGQDFTDGLDLSYAHLKSKNVLNLGYIPHRELIDLLKIADFFVQPGGSNNFNDYRFPSKLPEFFAAGKPVILPATNIGLRLRDRLDAFLLKRGDGVEIADRIEDILDCDTGTRQEIAKAGQDFVRRELDWTRNAQQLAMFYDSCSEQPALTDPDTSKNLAV